MVAAMASAYEGLSEEERERVFLLSVGKDVYKDDDQNFCKGFAACPDDSDNSWWNNWNSEQRDVFFYIKKDPNDADSWEYYCRYSMNSGRDEFDDTIREMLTITEKTIVEEVIEEIIEKFDEALGNETDTDITATPIEEPSSDPAPIVSDISTATISSSYSSSISNNHLSVLKLSAAVLGWSIL